jgi:hypothetical protein
VRVGTGVLPPLVILSSERVARILLTAFVEPGVGMLDACHLGVAERTCFFSVLSDRWRKSQQSARTSLPLSATWSDPREFFFCLPSSILCYLFGAKDSHLS